MPKFKNDLSPLKQIYFRFFHVYNFKIFLRNCATTFNEALHICFERYFAQTDRLKSFIG